ncbi:hypothetical protein EDC96DRAFT_545726 [Choanephora cucurbitarum]|nr:hypothetical protein EDC96DRAFT_545726 [Choanephora cucurbitarum]
MRDHASYRFHVSLQGSRHNLVAMKLFSQFLNQFVLQYSSHSSDSILKRNKYFLNYLFFFFLAMNVPLLYSPNFRIVRSDSIITKDMIKNDCCRKLTRKHDLIGFIPICVI